MLVGSETQALIREAQQTLREVRARSAPAQVFELLQERDEESKAVGTQPYTDAALAVLDAALAAAPDDIGLLHHAAIAHHARAWDLELQNDPRAAAEWALALQLWHRLATSQEFRTGLEAKLLTCDPNADPAPLHDALQMLLDNLLDVHGDFIRQYAEADELQHARAHTELVERAPFPPETKERFVARVFELLTGAVPDAKATQAYAPALAVIERFLTLFPTHLMALRLHAEICKEWVESLSYQDHWPEIEQLSARARPFAERIESHPQISLDALARTALEELAYVCADRASDRGAYYLSFNSTAPDSPLVKREKGRAAFRIAVEWARLGQRHSPPGSPVSGLLTYSLYYQAADRIAEAFESLSAELDAAAGITSIFTLDAAIKLYHASITDLEEAQAATPANEDVRRQLQKYRDELVDLESARNRLLLRGLEGGCL